MLHKFSRNSLNIALDTESGSVHILSKIASDIIDIFADCNNGKLLPQYEKTAYRKELSKEVKTALDLLADKHNYPKSEIYEAYNELCELFSQKSFYSDPVTLNYKKSPIPVKALCLHIAHDCNMRCKYCFASTGDFGRDRSIMTAETGKKAIDFLLEKSLSIKSLEVDFFGGEPLLAMKEIKEIVSYAREKENKYGKCFRFTITTNGTLLDDEIIDYINSEMSNCVLSIDGRKYINDKNRYFEDKSGCYDIIMPLYKKLVSKRGSKDYYVRGTFTKNNLDFANDVLHLANEGFEQISVEPVVTKDPELALTENDYDKIFSEYDRLTDIILDNRKNGKYFNFFHFMADIDDGPCIYKRTKGCGSGSEYLAITPSGDIFPCHQFVEHEEYKLGNVYNGTLDDEKRQSFKDCNIGNKLKKCSDCWDKYFCGGGCAANNYKFNASISEPYTQSCELQKKRTECILYMKAVEALDEE